MFVDEMIALSKSIHLIAEKSHCASAIMAVETLFAERLKKADGYYDRERRLTERANKLISENRRDEAFADLPKEFDAWRGQASKYHEIHIAIRYVPKITPHSARVIGQKQNLSVEICDSHMTITLPKHLLDTLLIGLNQLANGDTWTSEMRDAKEKLRELTLHELAHIAVMGGLIESKPTSVQEEEDAVEEFVVHLLDLRSERLGQVHILCEAPDETCRDCCPNRRRAG